MGLFGAMETVQLKVAGMHCPKCVARVKEALEGVEGVVSAGVDLDAEQATVEGTANAQELVEAVKAIGFDAELA